MFYQFLKILVGFTLRIFFKKIFITGQENIKNDFPQLIASNHPNGFLEPLIMACFFSKDLHFLVRGDVFDNPFLKPILTSTHQIPIFRFRDGFSKLRENSQKMDESMQVLLENKNLLIFAEGGTESIKKLRPLQKGIVRIAFQALDKNPDLNLEILPVGINFTYPTKFNKEVMLRVSPPILVQPYYKIYLDDKNKATEMLLTDLYGKVKENIIHLENQHRLKTFEQLVVAKRSSNPLPYLPVYEKDTKRLDIEKDVAKIVDGLNDEKFITLKSDLNAMETKMKKNGMIWNDLIKNPLNLTNSIILLIGIMPAILGFSLNLIPLAVGYFFTKTKVKQKEFKASILMVVTMVLFLLQYIILTALAIFGILPWLLILVAVISGLWLRYYYTIYENSKIINFKKLVEFKSEAINILNKI